MKKLALFLVFVCAGFATVFTSDGNNTLLRTEPITYISGCDGPKQEQTSNGVQVRLEICGSDRDGYDIDAVNPDSGEKRECTAKFTLTGIDKAEAKSVDVSKEKSFTVSSTAKGWFNAHGESGMKVKDLKISSFSVSCS